MNPFVATVGFHVGRDLALGNVLARPSDTNSFEHQIIHTRLGGCLWLRLGFWRNLCLLICRTDFESRLLTSPCAWSRHRNLLRPLLIIVICDGLGPMSTSPSRAGNRTPRCASLCNVLQQTAKRWPIAGFLNVFNRTGRAPGTIASVI